MLLVERCELGHINWFNLSDLSDGYWGNKGSWRGRKERARMTLFPGLQGWQLPTQPDSPLARHVVASMSLYLHFHE